ncbi:MAG: hypothetical protein K2H87_05010 [Duncaniella sp.]|nr:hypothetical protein [Duncaniella sp.]
MNTPQTIDLYRAVEEMKRISAEGGTFSIRFRKWNRDLHKGGDMASVAHARIRPKASDEKVANASHKLFITDTDTGRALNCWQPLVMEFNDMRTILN